MARWARSGLVMVATVLAMLLVGALVTIGFYAIIMR
jgi:hypothetical protein